MAYHIKALEDYAVYRRLRVKARMQAIAYLRYSTPDKLVEAEARYRAGSANENRPWRQRSAWLGVADGFKEVLEARNA